MTLIPTEEPLARLHTACLHMFHLGCLQRWATVSASCPIDRLPFVQASVVESISKEDDLEDSLATRSQNFKEISIETFELNSNDDLDNESDDGDFETCAVCSVADERLLVLCDVCNAGSHLACVGLRTVPRREWFCLDCRSRIRDATSAARRTPIQYALHLGQQPTNSSNNAPRMSRIQALREIRQDLARDRVNKLALIPSDPNIVIANVKKSNNTAMIDDDSDQGDVVLLQYIRMYKHGGGHKGKSVVWESAASCLHPTRNVGSIMSLEASYKRKREQEEREAKIAEKVKSILSPLYKRNEISKDAFKAIAKKATGVLCDGEFERRRRDLDGDKLRGGSSGSSSRVVDGQEEVESIAKKVVLEFVDLEKRAGKEFQILWMKK
ncbi:UNVERIFIED_CONTAM: hypothetical protein HDU68_004496 [Siphonaria sp. JEL0065]|nr:hypothetical protein HDU68_004496 [Siphonaria sp. JEL0065]